MTIRPVWALLGGIALLSACSDSEDAAPADDMAAQPEPVLTSAPTPTAAADGTALESGEWFIREDASGARALFGEPQTEASLVLECDPASGAVSLSLASDADSAEAWRLDAGGEAARIDMTPTGGELPQIAATIDHNLAIVQAMAEPGQSFSLTSPGGERRQYPAHPGIRRVIDSCN